MKKLFISLAFFLVALAGSAQTYWGVRGGMNLSKISDVKNFTQEWVIGGYNGGVVFKYLEGNKYGVQLEVNYSQAGYSVTEYMETPIIYERTFDYVEVPFLTHLLIGKKKVRPFLNLGGNLSFIVSETLTDNTAEVIEDEDFGNPFGTKAEPVVFSLVAGLGLNIPTGIGIFQLEGRYTQNLSNTIKADRELNTTWMQNQIVGVSLTYFLPKKKEKKETELKK